MVVGGVVVAGEIIAGVLGRVERGAHLGPDPPGSSSDRAGRTGDLHEFAVRIEVVVDRR